ncbi:MAG TPA: non-ribosomal peptide synthetase, partial [Oceanospirillales bacterium]|nr:non-ribosomal peptide synthetase [Oceanospirillales bacterium]
HIINDDTRISPNKLLEIFSSQRITHAFMPTALLEASFELFDQADTKLEYLLVGGEKLLKNGFIHSKTRLVNHYGPTESTVVATAYETNTKDRNAPPIGKPIANIRAYVLNNDLSLTPNRSIGELYLAGAGLARGYINQPELSKQSFINHTFNDGEQQRLYKTGDLVRYSADGNLEFIGRADDQIKIRGFRIELGEIEAQLHDCKHIQSALVVVYEGEDKEKRLIAYVTVNATKVTDESALTATLKSDLQKHLPDYMIPSAFVLIDKFPVTANGKIDKKALPIPDAIDKQDQYVAPQGHIQKALVEIWSKLLKIPADDISAQANFFELGGHSLLSIRLLAEIREEFNKELPVRDIFETPQLSLLAEIIKGVQSINTPKIVAISRDGAPLPSSFAQQRLWFIDQMDGGSAHYNIPTALHMQGNFKVRVAQQAFAEIIKRHESLRTVFIEGDGMPLQLIKESFSFKIKRQNLTVLSKKAQDKAINQAMQKDAEKSFNLGKDLMLRVSYLKLAKDAGIMLFNMHHIASDGWSIGLLINEFVTLYESILAKKASPLVALPIQYGDYAYWQRNWLQGDVLNKQLDYWGRQLAQLPQVHSLPLDYERPSMQTFNGAVQHFVLDKATLKTLKKLALDNQVTLFMLLHAAFAIVLSRYSNN